MLQRFAMVLGIGFVLGAAASAQQVSPLSGKFDLVLKGNNIGHAEFLFKQTSKGFSGTSKVNYKLGNAEMTTNYDWRDDQSYNSNWEIVNHTYLFIQNNPSGSGTKKGTIAPSDNNTKLTLNVEKPEGDDHYPFDLKPHAVVLQNFDVSGLQILLNMAHTSPSADGNYSCFIPGGNGHLLPCSLTPSDAAGGTLGGATIEVKRSILNLGPINMEVWSNADGVLLRAAVPVQSVAYNRQGFVPGKVQVTLPDGIEEREISFPTDGFTAPGTLTLPKSRTGKLPILVLLQGSGVQDRNATVGPNKVFQQLAWALAAKGIATVRYDRRAIFAPENFKQHVDLDHEVVIDAASALAFASMVPEADPSRVFLCGHSLGAQLAPDSVSRRIAAQPGSVKGLILLAGVETPIDLTIIRQMRDLSKDQGATEDQIKTSQQLWKDTFVEIRNPATPADKAEGVGGMKVPAGYWRDWLSRDSAASLSKLNLPTLNLRGSEDFNVVHEDFAALAAAATAPGSVSKEFPGLNHEFMAGKNILAPGKIDPVLVTTIADWVNNLK